MGSSGPKTVFLRASRASKTGASLVPDSLVREAQRRLRLMVWLIAGTFLVYFTLFQTVWVEFSGTFGRYHSLTVLALSVPVGLWLRKDRSADQVAFVGSLVVIAHGFGIAMTQYIYSPVFDIPSSQVSWVCVLILLLPFVVPASPKKVGVAAVLAATTDPLGLWASVAVGAPMPTSAALGSFLLPPFVTALLAWALAHAVYAMGREVSKARRLGAYELTERLGMGGMGEVWKASHRLLARPAAVKLIRSDTGSDGMAVERFEREAQATASLESPHTVELYDFGVAEDGTLYYVMELLRGVDLQTLIDEHGALPPERVVYLLLQACESLGEAHDRDMIHRDIKPANLFLCRKGPRTDFLKVLDFGLVKGAQAEDDPTKTQENQITGTPAYLAPEALRGDPPVSAKSDLYALGCVAFFLLTGRPVFQGKTTVAIASAHLHDNPAKPSKYADGVPAALDALVLELLAKDVDERPSDAAEVALRLRAIHLPVWTRDQADEWWATHLSDLD